MTYLHIHFQIEYNKYGLDHWINGPLIHCTFLGPFWGLFWNNFFGPLYWGMTYQWYLGRGGIQSINTQGGVVGRLLLLREGWVAVVLINATNKWSFH